MDLHVGVIGSLAALAMAGPSSCWTDGTGGLADPSLSGPGDGGIVVGPLGCPEEPRACDPEGCPAGTVCVADGCGGRACQPAGLPCLDGGDCPVGSFCFDGPLGSVCLTEGLCADDRDCPPGHACEEAGCVDRRLYCPADGACPRGSACDLHAVNSAPYCRAVDRACANDAACAVGALCLDADGDGHGRCAFPRP